MNRLSLSVPFAYHALMFASVLMSTLASPVPALGQINLQGDNLKVYFSSRGMFNDPASSRGLEVKQSGTFLPYTYPGTPHAGVTFEWMGNGLPRKFYAEETGFGTNMTVTSFVNQSTALAKKATVTWQPIAGEVTITRTYSFGTSSKFMFVDTTVLNTSQYLMTGFRAIDSIDPDNDFGLGGGSSTKNDTLILGNGTTVNFVQSLGAQTGNAIGYYSQQTGSTFGHIASWPSVDADTLLTDYNGVTNDYAMGYKFTDPSGILAPGNSLSYRYMISTGSNALEAQNLASDNFTPIPEPGAMLALLSPLAVLATWWSRYRTSKTSQATQEG